MYECSKLSVFGTEYKRDQYIILPQSTNVSLVFGKIAKLLCCEEYAYFLYQKSIPRYCQKTDLHFIVEHQQDLNFELIASHHLPDFRPLESYLGKP